VGPHSTYPSYHLFPPIPQLILMLPVELATPTKRFSTPLNASSTPTTHTISPSYGCASLVALRGVSMGFWACTLQGTIDNAIDNAAFSTIFMVMRNLELRDIVGNEGDNDVHQVPASLKQTSLRLGRVLRKG
jgi:hypothetical protein